MVIFKRLLAGGVISVALLVGLSLQVSATTTDSTTYGGGNYGACDYGSCSITLTSGGSTTLDVLPSSTGKCTVQSDTASVLTNSDVGYSLSMTTSTSANALIGGTTNISATSGSVASPAALTMNSWGFRVDGAGSFGGGPTATQTNGSVPGVTFAAVPTNAQTPATIATTSSPANPAVDTKVWYGLCADASVPADTYAATVVYTAVTN